MKLKIEKINVKMKKMLP